MFRHLQLFAFAALTATAVQAEPAFRPWAKTPPMDCNGWDCFGTTLTAEQAKAEADAMVRYLGKAIIATARKFLGIIYQTLKNDWIFEDFPNFVIANT